MGSESSGYAVVCWGVLAALSQKILNPDFVGSRSQSQRGLNVFDALEPLKGCFWALGLQYGFENPDKGTWKVAYGALEELGFRKPPSNADCERAGVDITHTTQTQLMVNSQTALYPILKGLGDLS